ncbi:MAG: helix-turn-helix domain-containing protein [Anaerolineae bacterium]
MAKRESRIQSTEFAGWLMRELDRRHMSAQEASLAAGMDHAAIHRFLSGTRPSATNTKKLAVYFGVPVDYVRELTGEEEPSPEHVRLATQIAELIGGWPEDEQEQALDVIRLLHQQREGRRAP